MKSLASQQGMRIFVKEAPVEAVKHSCGLSLRGIQTSRATHPFMMFCVAFPYDEQSEPHGYGSKTDTEVLDSYMLKIITVLT